MEDVETRRDPPEIDEDRMSEEPAPGHQDDLQHDREDHELPEPLLECLVEQWIHGSNSEYSDPGRACPRLRLGGERGGEEAARRGAEERPPVQSRSSGGGLR
jgi:hypothetical protein